MLILLCQNQSKRRRRHHKPEVTTHISIHTLHLDGLRELHRHFLRLDNGAIIEVYIDLIPRSLISKDREPVDKLDLMHAKTRSLELFILQIFGDFSSVLGISPVIKNSSNIHYSLSSFGCSETSLQSRASSSHISQSTPSLKSPAAEDVLGDQQDSVRNEASSGAKSSEIDHSNSSLKCHYEKSQALTIV